MNDRLLKKDKIIIAVTIVFIILSFIQGFIKQIVNIEEIDLIDDVFLLILFLFSVIFAFKYKLSIKRENLFLFIFPIAFFIYLFVTGIINKVPLITTAVSFRDYFQYIIFFFFLIVFFNEYMFGLIHNFILLFGILLLISSIYQIAIAVFLKNFHPDYISGTMGQSGAHLLSAVLVFYVGYYLSKITFLGNINRKEIIYLLSIIVLLIVIAFRTLLLFIPVILVIYMIITRLYRRRKILVITGIFLVSVFIILFIVDRTGLYVFNIRELFEEQITPRSGGRIYQLKYVLNNLLDNPIKQLFGTGPGSFFSKSCRYFNYERWLWVKNNLQIKGYIQYVITLAEIGFIGLISIIAFYILIIRKLKNDLYDYISNNLKVIIAATIFYIITYIFLGVGGNIFEWQETNMLLWFYIAYSYKAINGRYFSSSID